MASDKHLNFFYSYNRDEELIENNLTRSFIVTLIGVSPRIRSRILSTLLADATELDLGQVQFALQRAGPASPSSFAKKYIVTLTPGMVPRGLDVYRNPRDKCEPAAGETADNSDLALEDICGGSVPDAWIYDGSENQSYCFLIECKTHGGILSVPQLMRHAYQHYGWISPGEVNASTIALTWDDVLIAVDTLDCFENPQEEFLVANFVEFLGYFGHTVFDGVGLAGMPCLPPPVLRATGLDGASAPVGDTATLFRFRELAEVPSVVLGRPGGSALFDFANMP